jgi:regulator of RNase E activity RraB
MKDKEKQIDNSWRAKMVEKGLYKDTKTTSKENQIEEIVEELSHDIFEDENETIMELSRHLVAKGWEKLPEDSVVLSREEINEKQNEAWDRGIEYGKEIARKETAEKLLNDLWHSKLETTITIQHHSSKEDMENLGKAIINTIRNKIQELAKQSGVEIKE